MRWDSGANREPTEFERARRETVRYHEWLYASATERSYTLTSTLVTWLATRPEKPGATEP